MTTKTLPNSTTTAYYYDGSGVTLVNAGVQGRPGASGMNFGFVVAGNNDTLINNGTIFAQRVGVYVTGSGDSVVNAAGKNITATEARQGGINVYNYVGTVTNFGTISGYAGATSGNGGNAVELRHGGLVTNFGTLLNGGALFRLAPGTLVNAGVVLGDAAYGAVYMEAGGTVTNLAGGLISSNGATSSYDGAPPYGVFIVGGAATVTNAGTINGGSGNAVLLPTGFQNRVIVDPGAVFVGTVNGGTAVDATLELVSGASRGTLSGVGSQYINFGTVAFDPSASWLVKANTSIASSTITGFGASDTIDLAGFVAVSDTFAANTLVLTNASNAHVTLHMQGTFATANFSIAGDGGGGTDLGFTTIAAAALVYGQTIDEAGVVATSETVSAGSMTLFNGASPVGTVAVGTSLSSGDFILRPDGAGGTDVIVDTVFGTYAGGVTLLTNPTTIAASGNVRNSASNGKAVSGPTGTNWTLTNQGLVSETASGGIGISFASAGTIINASGGRITAASDGVVLNGGGFVTNATGGTIIGSTGVDANSAAATVINTGSIGATGATAAGVQVSDGGQVTNQSGGTITGYSGVLADNSPLTVVNAGSIGGNLTGINASGVVLFDGGTVTNQSGGRITGNYGVGVLALGTLVNAGTVTGNATDAAGFYASGGGLVANQSGGVIYGFRGVYAKTAALTVRNGGSIGGNASVGNGILLAAGGSVTNQSVGAISGYNGVEASGALATVMNAGLIYGSRTGSSAYGVKLSDGGSVTNMSSGSITAYNGVWIQGAPGTVLNLGLINAADVVDDDGRSGVYLQDGGLVTNGASGGGIASTASILGYGEFTGAVNLGSSGTGTLVNFGTVRAIPGHTGVIATNGTVINGPSGATGAVIAGGEQGNAVLISGAGMVINYATISAVTPTNPNQPVNFGVSVGGGGIIGNLGSLALIQAYLPVYAAQGATVINAGTIQSQYGAGPGAYSVVFGGGTNRLIIDPGAKFIGTVRGSSPTPITLAPGNVSASIVVATAAGTTTLELASATSAGTLSGLGTSIVNFASLVFDPGAQWTVAGNDSASGLGTLGIAGFTFGDTIDLTGFVATSRTFASNTLVLTNAGGVHQTLAMQGTFTTANVRIAGDGGDGTDISLQLDLNYGDTIDEAGIVATTQTVSAGVMTLRNGTTTVGSIAVGGTLTTSNFTLRPDGAGGTDVIVSTVFGTYTSGVTLLTNPTTIAGTASIGGTVGGIPSLYGPAGTAWTVTNQGTIINTGGNYGISFAGSGTITNAASGMIYGRYGGIEIYGAGASVLNLGHIEYSPVGAAIVLNNGGVFINGQAGGTASSASISGYNYGIRINSVGAPGETGTVVNFGTIDAPEGKGVSLVNGIFINGPTGATGALVDAYVGVCITESGTIVNYGAIANGSSGSGDYGILMVGAGTVANLGSASLIDAVIGIQAHSDATVINAGSIVSHYGASGVAIQFAAGTNLLVADPGAVFIGSLSAAGTTTLELASASSAGRLTGFGTEVTNFTSLVFDPGSRWTVAGGDSDGGLGTLGIGGFTFGDTIDLTGFAAASSTFASDTLVLTDSGGAHDTLHIQGTFVSGNFHLSSDGAGGTDIVFGAPPLLYGETIDEAGIVATSETVTAGVMTLFNGGGTAVGTIAVGTTLGTADFTLRPDGSGGTGVIVSSIFGTYTSGVTLLTNPTTIDGTGSITGTVSSGVGVIGPSGTAWTLVNQGLVSETGTSGLGISFASAGIITNAAGGIVTGGSFGIEFNAGGSVTNRSGGTIRGVQGIYVRTGSATVVNSGSIGGNNTSGSGIDLITGGTVTNLAGGTISGSYGVRAASVAATVVNAGSIGDGTSLPTGAAIALKNGGLIVNQTGGQIIAGLQGVYFGGAAGTVVNAGSIGGGPATGNGVIFATGGAVTNQSGGTITGKYGIRAVVSAITVVNTGGIGGNLTTGGGVNLAAGGGVTNQAGGTITGLKAINVTGGTVTNSGGVGGNTTLGTGAGVQLVSGGSLTNQSGGTVTGFAGVYGKTGAAAVVNAGSISGNTASGGGVFLAAGGSVTNQSGGVITGFDGILTAGGATVVNAGSIGGTTAVAFGSSATNRLVFDPGAVFSGIVDGGNTIGAASVSTLELASSASAGALSGLGTQFIHFAGVTVDTGANWTLNAANTLAAGVTLTNAGTLTATGSLWNDGTIIGTGEVVGDYGVVIGAAGTFGNLGTGALIQGYGGVLVGSGGTVTNAGTIGSTRGVDGTALRFTGGNARLIDDPGSVFAGTVDGDGTALLELTSASSSGTISGLGGSVTNFTSLVFDSGARWTVAGNDAAGGLGTLGISGFAIGDTIDLTGFTAVDETFASNALALTNGVGGHESLNIQGAFSTDNFVIVNDGDGGTDITFVIRPTIAAGGTVTFTGGGSPVTLDSSVNITDPNSTTLAGGTVSIGSFLTGDTLNFVDQDGIAGSFNSATGTLTLTGSATVADYQAALDSITYDFNPSLGDPTTGGDTTRTIDWVVNDGTNPSTVATSTLDTVHAAPSIATGGTVSFTGGGGAVALDSTLTLADPDSLGLLNGGTVSIAGFVAGDILSADTTGFAIGTSYDASTGVLMLSGSDTLADYQAVLRSVTYSVNPADGDPTGGGGDTSRTIDWLITDGASANGVSNTGTSTLDTVHVGPTITAGGTVSYTADGSAAALDPTIVITDADSAGTIAGATVSIGAGFTSGDLLNFVSQNGISGSYNAVTGTLTLSGAATIANYEAALASVTYTFTPDGGDPTASGSDASRIIAWTANDGVDNSAATTSTLDLTLPPPAIGGAVAGQTITDEATINPFSGVSITDPNSGQSETISITVSHAGTPTDADGTLSGTGLSKTGTGTYTLAAGSTDTVTTELDALVFTPTSHQAAPGIAITTGFTLAVTDTLNQSASNGITSVVATAVNDPPIIAGTVAGQSTTDETTLSPLSGVAISDVDFGQTETVTVTLSNAANGTLSNLDGGSYDDISGVYSVTGTDAAVTTAVDGLVFTPTAHQVAPGGSVTTTFTIAASDTAGGTTSNSTTTVAATAVNDPQVITGTVAGQAATDETTLSPFSGVGISDADFGQTETVTVTLSNAANGALSNLDGGSYDDVSGVYSVTGTDAAVTTAVDGLVFTPTAHQVPPGGSVATTFTIAATDTAGGTASNSTTTITATAVNDPPVITGTVAGQRMSNNATIRPFSGVTISDPDVGASETVTITLTYGGTPTNVYGTLSGAGLNKTGNGIYTLATGSADTVTAALDALIFTPIPDSVVPDRTITTGMTLSVTDGIAGSPTTDTTTSVNSIACFAAGTRIATPRGSVAVERLREGDMVLTVSGKPRPVQWIGRRTLDCDRHIAPERVKPVRIAPHAFGEDRPRRALMLSPDHSVFIEDVMIPIKHLINGATVTQIDVSTVTYYHIELERHDVVLAEGLPAETYLETGGRAAFENGGGAIDLHPDFAPDENRVGMVWRNFAYAPLIGGDGQLDRVRSRLALQAVMLTQQAAAAPRRTKRLRRRT